jgi:hypothetical protein
MGHITYEGKIRKTHKLLVTESQNKKSLVGIILKLEFSTTGCQNDSNDLDDIQLINLVPREIY